MSKANRLGWAVKHADRPDIFIMRHMDVGMCFWYDAARLSQLTRDHLQRWAADYGVKESHTRRQHGMATQQFLTVPVSRFLAEWQMAYGTLDSAIGKFTFTNGEARPGRWA